MKKKFNEVKHYFFYNKMINKKEFEERNNIFYISAAHLINSKNITHPHIFFLTRFLFSLRAMVGIGIIW
jgi:hypothetical protein